LAELICFTASARPRIADTSDLRRRFKNSSVNGGPSLRSLASRLEPRAAATETDLRGGVPLRQRFHTHFEEVSTNEFSFCFQHVFF
jgi:hypothetical protein